MAGGFLGYSLGVLLALTWGGEFDPALFVLGYAVVLFGDLSTHFSNDYFDVDVDSVAPSKTFGGSYVLVNIPEARPWAKVIAIASTAVSMSVAVAMVQLFVLPPILLLLVAVTNLFGWLYSAPPVRLNARGLGEVTIALGTGLAVPAVGYITTSGFVDTRFLVFSVPMVLYGLILSLSLEFPDLEVDVEYDRQNLVTVLGRRPVTYVILLLSITSTAVFTLFISHNFSSFWVIPLFSVIPILAGLMGSVIHPYTFEKVDRISAVNILALSLFLVALDGYLLLSLL